MLWNCVKAMLGLRVNVHLADGSVVVNVRVNKLDRDFYGKPIVQVDSRFILLSSIAHMDKLSEVMLGED